MKVLNLPDPTSLLLPQARIRKRNDEPLESSTQGTRPTIVRIFQCLFFLYAATCVQVTMPSRHCLSTITTIIIIIIKHPSPSTNTHSITSFRPDRVSSHHGYVSRTLSIEYPRLRPCCWDAAFGSRTDRDPPSFPARHGIVKPL